MRTCLQIVALTVGIAACGGGGSNDSGAAITAKQYDGCSNEGATAQSGDGASLQCILNSVGELMWDVAPTPTTLDAGSMADSTSTTTATGEVGSSVLPLRAIFGNDCDANGPSTYSTGIGDAEKWSHIVPLGAMVSTHVTPVDHIYVYYPFGSKNNPKGTFTVTSPADGVIVSVEDPTIAWSSPTLAICSACSSTWASYRVRRRKPLMVQPRLEAGAARSR